MAYEYFCPSCGKPDRLTAEVDGRVRVEFIDDGLLQVTEVTDFDSVPGHSDPVECWCGWVGGVEHLAPSPLRALFSIAKMLVDDHNSLKTLCAMSPPLSKMEKHLGLLHEAINALSDQVDS